MSQKDFLRNFDHLEICNITPDTLDDEQITNGKLQWHESTFNGSWVAGKISQRYLYYGRQHQREYNYFLITYLRLVKVFCIHIAAANFKTIMLT